MKIASQVLYPLASASQEDGISGMDHYTQFLFYFLNHRMLHWEWVIQPLIL
jgi:hypothetical protein